MTLVEFWTQERDLYRNRKTALTAALAQRQQELDKAKHADKTKGDPSDGLKTAQDALAAIDAKIAAKRADLAKSTIPAAAQALVIEIRDLQIDQRLKQGEILDLQEAVDALQQAVDAESRLLQRVTARLAESEAKLKTADDAKKRRDTLKARVSAAPLKDVPAQANTAKTGPDHNNAETRVKELPADLLALAQKRFDLRINRLASAAAQLRTAEDELVTQREAWGGEGKAEQERTAFLRAEQAIQEFASTAQPEYDRALNLFKSIAGSGVSLLSAPETAAIAATPARLAAAQNAEAVNAAQVAVDAAALDVENTEFGKLAADADADLSADAAVTAKKATLAAARTTLKDDSTTNYPDRQVTDEWQAIVPDRGWKSVVDFFEAKGILDRLAALSAVTLVNQLDAREAAYAGALADLAKARRRLEYLEDVTAQRGERVAALTAARGLRLVSAVRGDSL